MTGPANRRAILGSLAALPALTIPLATAALSSDLVRNAAFAVSHGDWINATAGIENWGDAKLDEEIERYWEAFDQVTARASGGLHEIQAKARLSLREMEDSGELENANPGLLLAADVLREVIALCA